MKQLVVYFLLAFFISWIIWLPLYGNILGLSDFPKIPFNHAIGGLGPLISSFITTWIFLKYKGVKKLAAHCLKIRPLIYLVIAMFSPFILAFLALIISYVINDTPINLRGLLRSKEYPEFHFLTFLIYNLVFFGFGEETGWRGFALPRLQTKLNAISASIILTAFWALWHIPLFLYRPGYTTMGVAGVTGWFFSLLTGSILLTWLYNSSSGSILICAVFHSTIDIAFTADLSGKNIVSYMGAFITIWGILTILVFKPKKLACRN